MRSAFPPTITALRRRMRAGFSLIECALALGVVSFGFVALVGMIPVGLNTFRSSIDATVGAQIAQGLLTEVRQAKFSELANFNSEAPCPSTVEPGPSKTQDGAQFPSI